MIERPDPTRTSSLLVQWAGGDRKAFDELLTYLYRDIHAIAVRELRSQRQLTINPTALVREANLRLEKLSELNWQDGGADGNRDLQ